MHHLEELDGNGLRGIVVAAGRVDVGDRLVQAAFGRANVLDAPEHLIE